MKVGNESVKLLVFLLISSCQAIDYDVSTSQDVSSKKFNSANTSCSLWKYDKYHNSSCVCGDDIDGVVKCRDDQSTVSLLTCNCMSYSDHGDMLLVGTCLYHCTNRFYTEITEHTNLNDLCNSDVQQNREGQMCGKCIENHSPSPYSYNLNCAHCSDYRHGWIKYLLIAYLPLTIFFIIVVFFRFNAMSPSMNAFIFYCQVVSCPTLMSLLSSFAYFSNKHPVVHHFDITLSEKVISTVYGIWNLDFFRMAYSPFCLHPNMSILQILSLDYVIAVYPLCLVGLTYLFVKLHDKFKAVQLLWKPMTILFLHLNHQWKASNSLIEAFGTFFLLSYIKIINTSFNILMPVQLRNVSGQLTGLYAYYNGSLVYFGPNHLPYAVLSIIMFVVFNLFPLLLLCLYPCRCFQSCLNCSRLNSQVLRTFMDAFQGCYKFEPYDCRYWAAFYLFLRIVVLAFFAITQSGYLVIVTGILLIPITALVAIIRPYRQTMYNVVDTVFFLAMILLCFSSAGLSLSAFNRRYENFTLIMIAMSVVFPPVYAVAFVIKRILSSKWIIRIMCSKLCRDGELFHVKEDVEDPLLQHLAIADN